MLTLSIPWLMLLLLLVAGVCFVFRRWKAGVAVLLTAIALNFVYHIYTIHLPRTSRDAGCEGDFKVMFFNACSSGGGFDDERLLEMVSAEDPDVVCFAEYGARATSRTDSVLHITLPYGNGRAAGKGWEPCIVYSRYELLEALNVTREGSFTDIHCGADAIYYTPCVVGKDTLDIVCCHLASNNILVGTGIVAQYDSVKSVSSLISYLRNVSAASRLRKEQAECLVRELSRCSASLGRPCSSDGLTLPTITCDGLTRPTIVVGDMNDVWGSGALRALRKAGLRDAWWHAGLGYGATIHHPLPYRIDHVMYCSGSCCGSCSGSCCGSCSGSCSVSCSGSCSGSCSDRLRLVSICRLRSHGLSDHDALVATFLLR